MTTGLWLAIGGLSSSEVAAAVPPTCRRRIDVMSDPAIETDGPDVLVPGPEWPVQGATYFLPSFAALTSAAYGVRLELSVRVGGVWSPFAAGVGLGPASFAAAAPVDVVRAEVDEFRTQAPAEAARARVRLRAGEAAAVLANGWMLGLSASDGDPPALKIATGPSVALEVPRRSQMEADQSISRRVCSPTCVAMVLDYWRQRRGHAPDGLRPQSLDALAAEILNPDVDLYGVWPAAIRAASRHGLLGYLLRFPGWEAAAYCLGRGIPVIASVRYGPGELTGAAVAETPGHLLVLRGWEGDDALVNDPAAPDVESVSRRYRLDELARVWLQRTGVGYVIFPPRGPTTGG